MLMALSCAVMYAACSDNDEGAEPFVTVATKSLVFPKSGGTDNLYVKTNVALQVQSSASWCKVEEGYFTENGTAKYVVTVESNTETDNRQAELTVTGGGISETVSVVQTAGDGLIVQTPLIDNVPASGGSFDVKLKANGAVTMTINDTWIKENVSTRAMEEQVKSFLVSPNYGAAREGSITFTVGDVTETVVVKQLEGSASGVEGEDAWQVAKSLGLGWNLGNQLDSYSNGVADETSWGNRAATQATFDKLAEVGFTSVRIPVTWLGHIGDAPDYTIDKAWLDRVAECVGYAESAGLKAIINIHHDGADSQHWIDIKNAAKDEAVNNQVKEQLAAVWTQIAERFKDKGSFLIFEGLNEIHDGGWGWGENRTDGGKQYAVLNEWNQVFVDAVRAVGGENTTRYLGVPGYCTNPSLTVEHFVLPTDVVENRLLVSVHFYDPTEFTLTAKFSEWGHTGAADKKDTWGDEDNVRNIFGSLKTKFVDQGIPVYVGEIGCVHRSDERSEAFRKYYLEYVCKAAKTYGLTPFYWDNGSSGAGKECSGLIDHGTGEILNNGQDIIDVMVKAIFSEDADYTLETVYNNAPL